MAFLEVAGCSAPSTSGPTTTPIERRWASSGIMPSPRRHAGGLRRRRVPTPPRLPGRGRHRRRRLRMPSTRRCQPCVGVARPQRRLLDTHPVDDARSCRRGSVAQPAGQCSTAAATSRPATSRDLLVGDIRTYFGELGLAPARRQRLVKSRSMTLRSRTRRIIGSAWTPDRGASRRDADRHRRIGSARKRGERPFGRTRLRRRVSPFRPA